MNCVAKSHYNKGTSISYSMLHLFTNVPSPIQLTTLYHFISTRTPLAIFMLSSVAASKRLQMIIRDNYTDGPVPEGQGFGS